MTWSHSSGVCSNIPLITKIAALFTRIVTGPRPLSTSANAGWSCARSDRSTRTASAGTFNARSSASTAAFFSTLRQSIATAEPALARPRAMPRPIPPLPPVTTATSPVRSNKFKFTVLLLSEPIPRCRCQDHNDEGWPETSHHRTYISEPDLGRHVNRRRRQTWMNQEAEWDAVYANRRRIRGARGTRLLRRRGELLTCCASNFRSPLDL